ncbi:hypothetical protein Q5752_004136 [Cryptotrichosporon argae]
MAAQTSAAGNPSLSDLVKTTVARYSQILDKRESCGVTRDTDLYVGWDLDDTLCQDNTQYPEANRRAMPGMKYLLKCIAGWSHSEIITYQKVGALPTVWDDLQRVGMSDFIETISACSSYTAGTKGDVPDAHGLFRYEPGGVVNCYKPPFINGTHRTVLLDADGNPSEERSLVGASDAERDVNANVVDVNRRVEASAVLLRNGPRSGALDVVIDDSGIVIELALKHCLDTVFIMLDHSGERRTECPKDATYCSKASEVETILRTLHAAKLNAAPASASVS